MYSITKSWSLKARPIPRNTRASPTIKKFSTRPSGDIYEIFVLGFKDSTKRCVLEIPALKGMPIIKILYRGYTAPASKSFVLEDCNFETQVYFYYPNHFPSSTNWYLILTGRMTKKRLSWAVIQIMYSSQQLKLSRKRANAVMAYLVSKGGLTFQAYCPGYGMTKPVTSNKTAEGRAQNRRTEVKILE